VLDSGLVFSGTLAFQYMESNSILLQSSVTTNLKCDE